MRFQSILFEKPAPDADFVSGQAPDFFTDLHLDQIVASITAGREEYQLEPFFHVPLKRVDSILYRHEVFRDLEDPALLGLVGSFAGKLRSMREHFARAERLHYPRQKQAVFLQAVRLYCEAVVELGRGLLQVGPRSRGFLALRDYLTAYTSSTCFTSLFSETRKLASGLAAVRYRLHIQGSRVRVREYASEPDYGAEVERSFEKFAEREQGSREYRFDLPSWPDMNHVEAAILDRVALLYPVLFQSLERYWNLNRGYLDETIGRFDREAQFYLACQDHFGRFELPFCYPEVTDRSKEVFGREVFDLALAARLASENAAVVTNHFHLRRPERVLVVTGPNQGGKTTFARTFGQLHYLASVGCPVPGARARLFLFDRLFTHFEREEKLETLSGKLEEELLRIHGILVQATARSVVILNEIFGSTSLADAVFLGGEILQRIVEIGALSVCVTFVDELASLSDATVSMVAMVDPGDPTTRTFQIVRRPADGLAYAAAIASKYGLTYEGVKGRIRS